MEKKETLEEVVNNFKKTHVYINEIKQEQERMYSEEDILTLLNEYNEYLFSFIDRDNVGIGTEKEDVKEWFEQFKKK